MASKRVSMGAVLRSIIGTNRPDIVRRLVLEAKSAGCVDCKYTLPLEVLDFDHVRAPKRFTISVSSPYSVKLVQEEIAVCDVRCPTCHRLRHYWLDHPDDPFFIGYDIPAGWVESRRIIEEWNAH